MLTKGIIQKIVTFVKINTIFLAGALMSLVLLLWYVPKTLASIIETDEIIKKEQGEVTKLKNQHKTLDAYREYNPREISDFINKLIPDSGDSFSIHTTLDLMTSKNGYTTTSRNVPANFTGKQQDIVVGLVLDGPIEKLPFILKSHMYEYGRFFILDKIDVDIEKKNVTLQMKFYNFLPSVSRNNMSLLVSPDRQFLTLLSSELKRVKLNTTIDVGSEEYIPS